MSIIETVCAAIYVLSMGGALIFFWAILLEAEKSGEKNENLIYSDRF